MHAVGAIENKHCDSVLIVTSQISKRMTVSQMTDHHCKPGWLPSYFFVNVKKIWKSTDSLVARLFLR